MKNLISYIWAFFFLIFSFFSAHAVIAQHIAPDVSQHNETSKITEKNTSISNIDFVKIKNQNTEEALFYYENNWKVLRNIALEKGYIQSYQLLVVQDHEKVDFDIMLMTEYKNEAQHEKSEANFQEIIDAQKDGLKLLNDIKPGDFREIIFHTTTQTAAKGNFFK